MSDPIKAWMCIGCGSIEAPQTCVGICQHRKVEFVHAFEHEATRAELVRVRAERDRLLALVRRVATVMPRDDAWRATLRAFQQDARTLVKAPPPREGLAETIGTDAAAR